jgi:hypothetical protein
MLLGITAFCFGNVQAQAKKFPSPAYADTIKNSKRQCGIHSQRERDLHKILRNLSWRQGQGGRHCGPRFAQTTGRPYFPLCAVTDRRGAFLDHYCWQQSHANL